MRAIVVAISLLAFTPAAQGQNKEPTLSKDLAAKLMHDDPKVRRQALGNLAQVDPSASGFWAAVVYTLSDPEPDNRMRAMAIISQVGPAAREAVPALIELFKKEVVADNKKAAMQTIGKIGPAASNAQDFLMDAVKHGNLDAITALGQIKSRKAIGLLLQVLELCEPDSYTGEGYREGYAVTARALGTLGVNDRQVLASLKRGLNLPGDFKGQYAADADTALRILTRPAFDQKAGASKAALPKELLAKLAAEDPSVRRQALGDLARIDPATQGFVPAIVNALSDPEPDNRVKAMAILGQIGPAAKDAVSAVIDIFKTDVVAANKKAAIQTLGKIGPAASNAQDFLMDTAKGGNLDAITALGQIKSQRAIGLLLEILQRCEPDGETTKGYREGYAATARALGAIGVTDPQVLASLRRGLTLPGDANSSFAADADTALRMLKARK